jgi:hypothetical protein
MLCSRVQHFLPRGVSQYPSMPATVIAQRVGWTGGHSWFGENAPADRCDRLVHLPGEQVQCDLWFPGQLVLITQRNGYAERVDVPGLG